jgi:hypothetical protein
MTESEALARMVAPGTHRPGKYGSNRGFGGVIQIHLTRACDKACFSCTQGSNLGGRSTFMSVQQFVAAVDSLRGYRGIVGVFGGNPALHPDFAEICRALRESWVPRHQRGVWCNNPITVEKAAEMRKTFDPSVSNLNIHLDKQAYRMFKAGWPECSPVGLDKDSRHAPVYVAMRDVLKKPCTACGGTGYDSPSGHSISDDCDECFGSGSLYDESRAWELISNCDINRHWSAMVGVFRGELRAWFCEIAGAQAILHQDDPSYPDTGLDPNKKWGGWDSHPTHGVHDDLSWWQLRMIMFREQVRKHCHECSVPLRGYGALAQGSDETQVEQVSATHQDIYKPKRKGRRVELVTIEEQLGERLGKVTSYIQNASK